MISVAATIRASIASSPPVKQKASASDNTASVIGGRSAPFRSGQGRCNRPDVAAIFAASQRLSVSVIIVKMAPAAGATITNASSACSVSPDEAAPRNPRNHCRALRITSLMVAASVPSVNRTAVVVSTAKPAIHSRMRPIGYHSSVGAAGAVPSPAAASPTCGPPQQSETPEPPGGQRNHDDKGDAIGKAEDRGEAGRRRRCRRSWR